MPPVVKTYLKKSSLIRRNSVEVVNALFAENISKRKEIQNGKINKRPKKIKLKELPPRDNNHYLLEDSIHGSFRLEDTFDKVCKQDDRIKTKNSAVTSILHKVVDNSEEHKNEVPENKEKTLDNSINCSLFIERVNPIKFINPWQDLKSFSTLSQDHVEVSSIAQHNDTNCNSATESSHYTIFTKSLHERNRVNVHIASTPANTSSISKKFDPVIHETISPIFNCAESKSLIEKSYEEINKWDYNPPNVFDIIPNIKKTKGRFLKNGHCKTDLKIKTKLHKRISVTCTNHSNSTYDWKLKVNPKIVLYNTLEVLGVTNSVRLNFPESKQNLIKSLKEHRKSSINRKFIKAETPSRQSVKKKANKTDRTPNLSVSYITLRRRKINFTEVKRKRTRNRVVNKRHTDSNDLQEISIATDNESIAEISAQLLTSNGKLNFKQNLEEINQSGSLSKQSNDEEFEKVNISIKNEQSINIDNLSSKEINVPQNTESLNDKNCDVPSISATENETAISDTGEPEVLKNDSADDTNMNSSNDNSVIENSQESISNSNVEDIIKNIGMQFNFPKTADFDDNYKLGISNGCENIDSVIYITSDEEDYNNTEVSKNNTSLCVSINSNQESIKSPKPISIYSSSDDDTGEFENIRLQMDDSSNNSSVIMENCESCNSSYNTSSKKYDSNDISEKLQTTYEKPVLLDGLKICHNCSIEKYKSYLRSHSSFKDSIDELSNDSTRPHNFYESSTTDRIDSNTETLTPADVTDLESSLSNPLEPTNTTVFESTTNYQVKAIYSTAFESNDFTTFESTHSTVNHSFVPADATSVISKTENQIFVAQPKSLTLKIGKLWRRSLLEIRRSGLLQLRSSICKAVTGSTCTCLQHQKQYFKNNQLLTNGDKLSFQNIPEKGEYLNNSGSFYGFDNVQNTIYENSITVFPVLNQTRPNLNDDANSEEIARNMVLRKCGQAEPLLFSESYPPTVLQNCFKIGEGVYGEVFLFRNANKGCTVMKVIPIEGNKLVNGEHQKRYHEILSEIVIAMELSNLRNNTKYKTDSFNEVKQIRCLKGRYPAKLLDIWNLYDECTGSENDSPEMFDDDQLFIALELANGGKDLESFIFNNALQAYSVFMQIVCALAVAESAIEFEHRDLHWGNVLISKSEKKVITYCLNGREFTIPSHGVEASIIDFTLSRVKYDDIVIYNDISKDLDLFSATGDYQFEIYKLMQKQNRNDWEHFEPYTNVLWLDYILDKMLKMVNYSYKKSKIHKKSLIDLQELKTAILNYNSVYEVVNSEVLTN